MASSKLRLIDRADMVKGHFCIGRYAAGSTPAFPITEYWSDHAQGFTSFGTVIVGKKEAQAKLKEIQRWLRLSPFKQRLELLNTKGQFSIQELPSDQGGFYKVRVQLPRHSIEGVDSDFLEAMHDFSRELNFWLQAKP